MIQNDQLTERIISAALEVHRSLGPGLLESAYEDCLALELKLSGVGVGLLINFNSALLKDGIRRYVLPGYIAGIAGESAVVV